MRHPGIVPLLVGPGYTRGDTHGTSRSRLLSPACSSWTSFCFCGQMAAVTCRTARRQPLERLMRTALALDPTQRITTLIIVLLNEPTLPAEVRNTCMGGLFVFQSAARAPSTSNLPVLTCRCNQNGSAETWRELNPLCLPFLKASSCLHLSPDQGDGLSISRTR
jgi:hypothetical protein